MTISDERIDRAIDDVARELTAGAASAQFTARVIERIDRRRPLWRAAWVLAPIGAAAMIAAAIVNWPAPPGPGSATSQPAAIPTPIAKTPTHETPVKPTPEQTRGPVERIISHPQITARAQASPIDALAPPPLDLIPITVPDIQLDPIATPPIEDVASITITPLEPPESDGSQRRFE
jgi:hypothetical protein